MNVKHRLPELDLLRFCAALLVTVYHLCKWPDGGQPIKDIAKFGFLGVEVFFIISGYVILMTAEHRGPLAFAKSRVARLYPTFWICVFVTSAALAINGEPPSAAMIAANLTMVPPLFHAHYVDLVYWTLVVELRFYAMVLVLLMFGQMGRVELWLGLWVAGLCASHLQLAPALLHVQHALQWLTLDTWGSLFASGCYFYLIATRGASWRYFAPLLVCMGLSAFDVYSHQDGSRYPWTVPDMAVMGGFVIVAYGVFLGLSLRLWRLPPSPAWYWLGGLTYPLYLLHAQAGRILWVKLPLPDWWRSAAVLAASLLAAALLARYSERRACRALQRLLDALEARIRARFARPSMPATQSNGNPAAERVIK